MCKAEGRPISGITPACAGNTPISPASARIALGSPPRVRGIPAAVQGCLEADGITPACAGNTLNQVGCSKIKRDHPRVCGEYKMAAAPVNRAWGSPPRVRGIRRKCPPCCLCPRITPACAGNTSPCRMSICVHRDHPRVCGEYPVFDAFECHIKGSPPRVRGIRYSITQYRRVLGITPACAGNTRIPPKADSW